MTGGGIIQAGQQLHQAGFCAAGAADDADGLAGTDVQVDIRQHIAAIGLIAEADMIKADSAVLDFHNRVFAVGQGAFFFQHFSHTLGGSGGHGDHDEHHGQHHQAGQDVGAVGQHAHQLAGGKAGSTGQHDHAGTQPGNQQDAGVNGGHHQRRVEGKNFFSTQQQILHIAGCLFELFTLVIFAHIRFDHADGGNIFLHALVQVIVLFECGGEVVAGAGHDEHQAAAQNDDRHQIDGSQLGVDGHCHDHGNDHAGRRTDGHTQNHLVSVLDVGHVGGHTGDQTGGGIFIDIGKAECLDIAVHGAAQISGVTGGSTRTKHTAQHAEQQAKGRCHDHPAANAVNVGKIAGGNAIINDGGHQLGDDHFHHHFADHAQRGQDGNQPEPLCFFVK